MLALALPSDTARPGDGTESALALYDVMAERKINSFTLRELTRMFLESEDAFVSDDVDRAVLAEDALTWASVFGWSVDGRMLLVWAQGTGDAVSDAGPSVLESLQRRVIAGGYHAYKRIKPMLPGSHNRPEFQRNRFPNIPPDRIKSKIGRIQQLLDDPTRVSVEPLSDVLFQVKVS